MENKMTNLMALNFVVENCELPADVMEKITNIRNSYAKKAEYKPTGERKPTAKQIENDNLKLAILEAMEENKFYTIAELTEACKPLNGMSNQKVSALLRQLLAVGSIFKDYNKRTPIYSLA